MTEQKHLIHPDTNIEDLPEEKTKTSSRVGTNTEGVKTFDFNARIPADRANATTDRVGMIMTHVYHMLNTPKEDHDAMMNAVWRRDNAQRGLRTVLSETYENSRTYILYSADVVKGENPDGTSYERKYWRKVEEYDEYPGLIDAVNRAGVILAEDPDAQIAFGIRDCQVLEPGVHLIK